ncbi:SVM family protein [Candidatus Phytoplasma melaleucae]|uniref:SVM family protein n=1 Tax=Candidatus Phytoplasma melaleucae TaxID=2982630 RepID=A0ABT9DFK5_9MOLU|nr:SVM family protein ['Melaleuca sp.' phytoplasma]MDO8168220.1 SVM family protein ['Melaleuca sp.' phytoplasma]MDV3205496.1 SVM family protein [Weeping tea tree witches'-broom phytoplasma]
MFKFKKQLYLLKLFALIFLGLLICTNNNFLFAAPGIDLEARMKQLTEEQGNLLQQLSNNFNNLNLDNETRLMRMQNIVAAIDLVSEQITTINQQLILREQFQRQRTNNHSNTSNNSRRN